MTLTEADKDRLQTKQYALAIDLGSGGPKAAVVAADGRVVAAAAETIETRLLPDGGGEQDAEAWWRLSLAAARRALKNAAVSKDRIVAVGCDSQWSLAVPVNQNGVPLMNAIHWTDTRGGRYNREITAGFPRVQGYGLFKLLKWIRLTGLAPTLSGVDSLGHVLFIKNERPDIYARTFKFLEPMDYLTSRLTGRITATQKTMVAFMVVESGRWGQTDYSDKLLALAGLDRDKFPELIENDGIVGPLDQGVAAELGLNPATPVVAGITDSNASLIGSGAVRDFDAIVYIGTTLYLTCHVPFKKTDLKHFITALPSPFPSRYYLLGEQCTGGKCVEYCLRQLVYPDDDLETGPMPPDAYERFNALVKSAPPGSGGVVFLPWLNGLVVPEESPYVRGGFMNLSLKTTRAHLARAVFEGLAFNSRWVCGPMEKFIGRPIESIRFSGGGALSNTWSQIHADVLGKPVLQVADPLNTTVRGAGLLALTAVGAVPPEDLSALVPIENVFEPNPDHQAAYDKAFSHFLELFKKNKHTFGRMNG